MKCSNRGCVGAGERACAVEGFGETVLCTSCFALFDRDGRVVTSDPGPPESEAKPRELEGCFVAGCTRGVDRAETYEGGELELCEPCAVRLGFEATPAPVKRNLVDELPLEPAPAPKPKPKKKSSRKKKSSKA